MAAYPLFYVQAATKASEMKSAPVPAADNLSREQLDNLLAPIALYPDPLLAQMLPASTFVDQIDQAARYLRGNNNQTTGVDNQSWDVSVKSIAHYPQVVFSMSEKLDWTTALGQAYVSQGADVFDSIQRLRKKAKDAGFLVTSPQQTVVVEKEIIKVEPAQPQYIYVPTYNPQVVYVSSGPSTAAIAAITFSTGLLIGAWLNNDCNWYSRTVFYHGWHGVGWVSRSVGVVRINNSFYVNSRYSVVHYNSAIIHRNVNYNNIYRYNNVSRNVNYNNINRNNVNINNVNRNNINRNDVNTNNINRNNVNNRNVNRNIRTDSGNTNAFRGKTNTPTTRPTQMNTNRTSGFGGSGNGAQTRQYSSRGQASRTSTPSGSFGGGRSGGGGGGRRR